MMLPEALAIILIHDLGDSQTYTKYLQEAYQRLRNHVYMIGSTSHSLNLYVNIGINVNYLILSSQ